MYKKLRIIPDFKNLSCITFNPYYLDKLNVSQLKRAFLMYGINAYEVEVKKSDEICENEVLISIGVINELLISSKPSYEILINNNEIILGPSIGILATKKSETLDGIINNLSNYVYSYENIGGIVYAFSLEGINEDEETISGYMYDPETKHWIKSRFFYPSVIFKRTYINKKWRTYFHKKLRGNIFNDYGFNKWQAYNWLKQDKQISKYFPDTLKYKKIKDIIYFLKIHKEAYLKHKYGSQGDNIFKIIKKLKYYIVNYRDKEKGENIVRILDKNELKEFLNKLNVNHMYIIQKSIKFILYNQRNVDFRVMLLKDENKKWNVTGIITRIGKEKSVISNVSGGGSALMSDEFLKGYMGMDDEKVFSILNEMKNIAIKVANSLEHSGMHLANLGFDMGIDENGYIWIIEINNRDPNHTIAIDAKNKQIFYKSKLTTMLYAKRLCGFR